jgi:hypothetical protein
LYSEEEISGQIQADFLVFPGFSGFSEIFNKKIYPLAFSKHFLCRYLSRGKTLMIKGGGWE